MREGEATRQALLQAQANVGRKIVRAQLMCRDRGASAGHGPYLNGLLRLGLPGGEAGAERRDVTRGGGSALVNLCLVVRGAPAAHPRTRSLGLHGTRRLRHISRQRTADF